MSEPGHYSKPPSKPPFTDEQLARLEKIFTTLGQDIEQQSHSYFCRNDAAREAIGNVARAIKFFQPQFVEP